MHQRILQLVVHRRAGALSAAAAVLLLMFAADGRAAGDPLAAAFSKAAKAALKDLKGQTNAAVVATKTGLKAAAADFAAGTTTATQAFDAAASTVTAQRDAIEDAAASAATAISIAGHDILSAAAVTAPGRDFLAGGRGVWDKSQRSIEKLLDVVDVKLALAFGAFVKSAETSAGKAGEPLDARFRLPPHGEDFLTVAPPFVADVIAVPAGVTEHTRPAIAAAGANAAAAAKAANLLPTQVSVHSRFRQGVVDHGSVGIRGLIGPVNVTASTDLAEAVVLPPISLDAFGVGLGSFDLAGQLLDTSFLTLELNPDAEDGPDARTSLSRPRLGAPAPDIGPVIADFRAHAGLELKFFRAISGTITKDFGKILAGILKDASSGQATVEQALDNGLDNLASVRNAMGFWYDATVSSPVTQAETAMGLAGRLEADIPGDIVPDSGEFFSGKARAWVLTLDVRHAALTKSFDAFLGSIETLADKHTVVLETTSVTGRTRPHAPPIVTLSSTPPVFEQVRPHITDTVLIATDPGTPALQAFVVTQADPTVVPTVQLAAENDLDGEIALGPVSTSFGGTGSDQAVLPTYLAFLLEEFRSGESLDKVQCRVPIVAPHLTLVH